MTISKDDRLKMLENIISELEHIRGFYVFRSPISMLIENAVIFIESAQTLEIGFSLEDSINKDKS